MAQDDMVYHHYVRSWHIQVIKTAYKVFEGVNLHIHKPPGTVARVLVGEFPMRMNHFPLEDYDKLDRFSLPILDEWFAQDWIPWARFQPMFSGHQSAAMDRLVEGVFRFGNRWIILSLKLRIGFEMMSDGGGMAILTSLIVMDSLVRTG
jgi:hypothetical protein